LENYALGNSFLHTYVSNQLGANEIFLKPTLTPNFLDNIR